MGNLFKKGDKVNFQFGNNHIAGVIVSRTIGHYSKWDIMFDGMTVSIDYKMLRRV